MDFPNFAICDRTAFLDAPVYLSLSVSCLSRKNSNPIYDIDMRFGRYNPPPAVLFDKELGSNFGIGRPETIKQIFKENVERAITYYIKANFDF